MPLDFGSDSFGFFGAREIAVLFKIKQISGRSDYEDSLDGDSLGFNF